MHDSEKKRTEIVSKFQKFQKSKDVGQLADIQEMVDREGKSFMIEAEDGKRVLFRPKKDPLVQDRSAKPKESLREKILKRGREKRTPGGIILLN